MDATGAVLASSAAYMGASFVYVQGVKKETRVFAVLGVGRLVVDAVSCSLVGPHAREGLS